MLRVRLNLGTYSQVSLGAVPPFGGCSPGPQRATGTADSGTCCRRLEAIVLLSCAGDISEMHATPGTWRLWLWRRTRARERQYITASSNTESIGVMNGARHEMKRLIVQRASWQSDAAVCCRALSVNWSQQQQQQPELHDRMAHQPVGCCCIASPLHLLPQYCIL